jgi:hypothetical protein
MGRDGLRNWVPLPSLLWPSPSLARPGRPFTDAPLLLSMARSLDLLEEVHPDPAPTDLVDVRQMVPSTPLVDRDHANPEQFGGLGRAQPHVDGVWRGRPLRDAVAAEPFDPVRVARGAL